MFKCSTVPAEKDLDLGVEIEEIYQKQKKKFFIGLARYCYHFFGEFSELCTVQDRPT